MTLAPHEPGSQDSPGRDQHTDPANVIVQSLPEHRGHSARWWATRVLAPVVGLAIVAAGSAYAATQGSSGSHPTGLIGEKHPGGPPLGHKEGTRVAPTKISARPKTTKPAISPTSVASSTPAAQSASPSNAYMCSSDFQGTLPCDGTQTEVHVTTCTIDQNTSADEIEFTVTNPTKATITGLVGIEFEDNGPGDSIAYHGLMNLVQVESIVPGQTVSKTYEDSPWTAVGATLGNRCLVNYRSFPG